jgi:type IV pilus assembly protein PilY1
MAINPFTGARLSSSFFDVNRDGQFTTADDVMVNNQLAGASGIGFGDGLNATVVGNTLNANLNSSEIEAIAIRPPASDAGRMSWREIVN